MSADVYRIVTSVDNILHRLRLRLRLRLRVPLLRERERVGKLSAAFSSAGTERTKVKRLERTLASGSSPWT